MSTFYFRMLTPAPPVLVSRWPLRGHCCGSLNAWPYLKKKSTTQRAFLSARRPLTKHYISSVNHIISNNWPLREHFHVSQEATYWALYFQCQRHHNLKQLATRWTFLCWSSVKSESLFIVKFMAIQRSYILVNRTTTVKTFLFIKCVATFFFYFTSIWPLSKHLITVAAVTIIIIIIWPEFYFFYLSFSDST